MKIIGIKRNSGCDGRVCIPKEMRDEIGLENNGTYEVLLGELDGEKVIIIRKPKEEQK